MAAPLTAETTGAVKEEDTPGSDERGLEQDSHTQGTVNHAKTATTPRHTAHSPPDSSWRIGTVPQTERKKKGGGCPQLRTPYYSVRPPGACM